MVLTNDNPRSEMPEAIIDDVLPGLRSTESQWIVEPDRSKAIALAVQQAAAGDMVLIAGKGHEKVQVLRDGTVPFDDVEVAGRALEPVLKQIKTEVRRRTAG